MRWARFEKNGQPCYAVIEGDTVIPVRGSPFEAWERTAERLKLADVKLLVPVVPPTFYAAGMNYAEHVREVAVKLGREPDFPPNADAGYRTVNALIADGESIVIPADATDLVQYEGELVVVIGRKCKHLTRENALSAVLGYTIGNDVSERTWQKSDRTLWRAKNTDTFKPMGPWIETDVKLADLRTTVRLNGEEKIVFETNKMIHAWWTSWCR
jgi:2-keto-4-pentenoate hydratase/2-oxohepta-3-ene-1,7-dioic acid hydratase in catechol pathway